MDVETIKELKAIFYKFRWNEKVDKIKRNVIINNYAEGGLKMIDIASFNKPLEAYWIKESLSIENSSSWKSILDLELQPYGGKVVLLGKLNKKDMHNIFKKSGPFVKEIPEISSATSFEEKFTSDKHLMSSPLWYNSLIRIDDKPVFYKDWFFKGITKVENLMDEFSKFPSPNAFQNEYGQ